MKKMVWLMMFVLAISLFVSAYPAVAQEPGELLRVSEMRAEPMDVRDAIGAQMDFWGEFFKGLVLHGKPCAVFSQETLAGVETTFAEGVLTNKVDWIGGFTFRNEERGKFFMGLQYNGLGQPGGIWQIFETLKPAVYLIEGDWFLGAGYEF